MYIRIIILALATGLLWNSGYCEENIYTWKDKNGVLNITDYPPPPEAEILDISPSHRAKAEEYWRQRQLQQERMEQAEQRRIQEEQAAEARTKEAEAYREADRLLKKAQEVKEEQRPPRKRRGYGY